MIVILLAVISLVCEHAELKMMVEGLAIQKFQDKIKGIIALEANNG